MGDNRNEANKYLRFSHEGRLQGLRGGGIHKLPPARLDLLASFVEVIMRTSKVQSVQQGAYTQNSHTKENKDNQSESVAVHLHNAALRLVPGLVAIAKWHIREQAIWFTG